MNMALTPLRDQQQADGEFLQDVLHGLRQKQKSLPCKYLYDETGSKLFEKICQLDDYYLTRTEAEIFEDKLQDIASSIGPAAFVVEPGAGNCEKAQPLLAALESPAGYMPIDISPEILLCAESTIQQRQPELKVNAVVGDFTEEPAWKPLNRIGDCKRVIFFPGSTIGNFDPQQARALLQDFSRRLTTGDGLLIGADLVKDSVVLERAYHDSEHVTAAFNKNLLARINSELGGSFDLSLFAHRAFYHPLRHRVEMHLVSLKDHCVSVAGETIPFEEGETIHTENSHKYTLDGFRKLLVETGYTPVKHWIDDKHLYAVHFAQIA